MVVKTIIEENILFPFLTQPLAHPFTAPLSFIHLFCHSFLLTLSFTVTHTHTHLFILSHSLSLSLSLSLFVLRPTTGQVRHRAFFKKWVRTQGRSPHTSGKIQKYLRPRRHSPNGGRLRRQETKQQTIDKTIDELSFTNTLIHSIFLTHSHLLTLSFPPSFSLHHSLSFIHSFYHSFSLTPSFTLLLSHTHSLNLLLFFSRSLSFTHFLIFSLTHSLTLPLSLSYYPNLSLSLIHSTNNMF